MASQKKSTSIFMSSEKRGKITLGVIAFLIIAFGVVFFFWERSLKNKIISDMRDLQEIQLQLEQSKMKADATRQQSESNNLLIVPTTTNNKANMTKPVLLRKKN